MLGLDIAFRPMCNIWPLYLQPFRRYGWCPLQFKWFTWPDHSPFRDSLLCVG